MILTLLIWLYIFVVSTGWGLLLWNLVRKINNQQQGLVPFFIVNITGLALLCSFLGFFSIFYRIEFFANLVVFTLTVIFFFAFQKDTISYLLEAKKYIHSAKPLMIVFLFLGFLIVLLETVSEVKIYDTGLYHAQAIRWINEYGIVPGLGNLHQRFAFNNHNFLLEALFNFNFISQKTWHVLNGYLTFVFTMIILYYFDREFQNKKITSLLYLLLLTIPFYFYEKFISSPSPDIAVALIIVLIFIIYLNFQDNFLISYWALLILSALVITIKISSIPIILLPACHFFQNIKKLKTVHWICSIVVLLVFFVPYLIRNVILSGYILYPFAQLDLLNVDWKIPKEYVNQMDIIIKGWARTKEWNIDKSLFHWLPIWFNKLTIFNKLSVVVSITGPLAILITGVFAKFKSKIYKEEKILSLVLLVSVLFWLTSAPDLRFIFHIQVFTGFFLLILLFRNLDVKKLDTKFLYSVGVPFILIIFLLINAYQSIKIKSLSKNLWVQQAYPSPKSVSISKESIIINTPEDNELCWDLCLPCSITQDRIGISPELELRGPSLAEGFRATKR